MEENPQLTGETLVAAAGLLQPPDETAQLAAQTLLDQLKTQMLAVLDRDEQTSLKVNSQTQKYLAKLAKTPPTEAWFETLEQSHGPAVAAAYLDTHQRSRQLLQQAYPGLDLDGIFGVTVIEPDHESLAQWLLLVDTIENQRIIKDLAAGALLPEVVLAFAAAYPNIYNELIRVLDDRLAELRQEEWSPPHWLEVSLATFKQLPIKPIKPMPLPEAPKPSRVKIDTERLDTASDKVL